MMKVNVAEDEFSEGRRVTWQMSRDSITPHTGDWRRRYMTRGDRYVIINVSFLSLGWRCRTWQCHVTCDTQNCWFWHVKWYCQTVWKGEGGRKMKKSRDVHNLLGLFPVQSWHVSGPLSISFIYFWFLLSIRVLNHSLSPPILSHCFYFHSFPVCISSCSFLLSCPGFSGASCTTCFWNSKVF